MVQQLHESPYAVVCPSVGVLGQLHLLLVRSTSGCGRRGGKRGGRGIISETSLTCICHVEVRNVILASVLVVSEIIVASDGPVGAHICDVRFAM